MVAWQVVVVLTVVWEAARLAADPMVALEAAHPVVVQMAA